MKSKLWMLLAPLILIGALPIASGDTALDRYLALRRQTHADQIKTSQAAASPDTAVGRTLELRGTVSGSARRGDSVSMIMDTPDGSFVVNTTEDHNIGSGSSICALVEVGEKCKLSLTDLRLVAFAYQCDVVERERRAVEAEARARDAANERKAAVLARTKRVQKSSTSRAVVVSNPEQMVAAYKNAIKGFNKRLSDSDADAIARSIIAFSAKYRVDPRLVVAVILAESHFRPDATSKKGAMGLGQLMPGTAAGLGVSNAYDPISNVAGSVRLIKGHIDRMSGGAEWNDLTWHDLSLALASYNAGPGAVRKYGGVPPYRETRNYVDRVCSIYKKLCGAQ